MSEVGITVVHSGAFKRLMEYGYVSEGHTKCPGQSASQTEAGAGRSPLQLYESFMLLISFVDVADGTAKSSYHYDPVTILNPMTVPEEFHEPVIFALTMGVAGLEADPDKLPAAGYGIPMFDIVEYAAKQKKDLVSRANRLQGTMC